METPDKFVYHGTEKLFDSDHAIPKINRRIKVGDDGKENVIFEEESFHATPHRWIALAYTYSAKPYPMGERVVGYNMGVSLYNNDKVVVVYGFGSLEESLFKLYGDGGYLYHFDKDKFFYKEGLGNLEVIIKDPIKPVTIEKIDNPVEEMQKLGVTFKFVDLALPENAKHRNYKSTNV